MSRQPSFIESHFPKNFGGLSNRKLGQMTAQHKRVERIKAEQAKMQARPSSAGPISTRRESSGVGTITPKCVDVKPTIVSEACGESSQRAHDVGRAVKTSGEEWREKSDARRDRFEEVTTEDTTLWFASKLKEAAELFTEGYASYQVGAALFAGAVPDAIPFLIAGLSLVNIAEKAAESLPSSVVVDKIGSKAHIVTELTRSPYYSAVLALAGGAGLTSLGQSLTTVASTIAPMVAQKGFVSHYQEEASQSVFTAESLQEQGVPKKGSELLMKKLVKADILQETETGLTLNPDISAKDLKTAIHRALYGEGKQDKKDIKYVNQVLAALEAPRREALAKAEVATDAFGGLMASANRVMVAKSIDMTPDPRGLSGRTMDALSGLGSGVISMPQSVYKQLTNAKVTDAILPGLLAYGLVAKDTGSGRLALGLARPLAATTIILLSGAMGVEGAVVCTTDTCSVDNPLVTQKVDGVTLPPIVGPAAGAWSTFFTTLGLTQTEYDSCSALEKLNTAVADAQINGVTLSAIQSAVTDLDTGSGATWSACPVGPSIPCASNECDISAPTSHLDIEGLSDSQADTLARLLGIDSDELACHTITTLGKHINSLIAADSLMASDVTSAVISLDGRTVPCNEPAFDQFIRLAQTGKQDKCEEAEVLVDRVCDSVTPLTYNSTTAQRQSYILEFDARDLGFLTGEVIQRANQTMMDYGKWFTAHHTLNVTVQAAVTPPPFNPAEVAKIDLTMFRQVQEWLGAYPLEYADTVKVEAATAKSSAQSAHDLATGAQTSVDGVSLTVSDLGRVVEGVDTRVNQTATSVVGLSGRLSSAEVEVINLDTRLNVTASEAAQALLDADAAKIQASTALSSAESVSGIALAAQNASDVAVAKLGSLSTARIGNLQDRYVLDTAFWDGLDASLQTIITANLTATDPNLSPDFWRGESPSESSITDAVRWGVQIREIFAKHTEGVSVATKAQALQSASELEASITSFFDTQKVIYESLSVTTGYTAPPATSASLDQKQTWAYNFDSAYTVASSSAVENVVGIAQNAEAVALGVEGRFSYVETTVAGHTRAINATVDLVSRTQARVVLDLERSVKTCHEAHLGSGGSSVTACQTNETTIYDDSMALAVDRQHDYALVEGVGPFFYIPEGSDGTESVVLKELTQEEYASTLSTLGISSGGSARRMLSASVTSADALRAVSTALRISGEAVLLTGDVESAHELRFDAQRAEKSFAKLEGGSAFQKASRVHAYNDKEPVIDRNMIIGFAGAGFTLLTGIVLGGCLVKKRIKVNVERDIVQERNLLLTHAVLEMQASGGGNVAPSALRVYATPKMASDVYNGVQDHDEAVGQIIASFQSAHRPASLERGLMRQSTVAVRGLDDRDLEAYNAFSSPVRSRVGSNGSHRPGGLNIAKDKDGRPDGRAIQMQEIRRPLALPNFVSTAIADINEIERSAETFSPLVASGKGEAALAKLAKWKIDLVRVDDTMEESYAVFCKAIHDVALSPEDSNAVGVLVGMLELG
jgi:hypothetical protein